jgi:hypothetical protein
MTLSFILSVILIVADVTGSGAEHDLYQLKEHADALLASANATVWSDMSAEDIIGALEQLESNAMKNFSSIKYWHGEAALLNEHEISDDQRQSLGINAVDGCTEYMSRNVVFALDVGADKLFTDVTTTERRFIERSGRQLQPQKRIQPHDLKAVLTNDGFIHMSKQAAWGTLTILKDYPAGVGRPRAYRDESVVGRQQYLGDVPNLQGLLGFHGRPHFGEVLSHYKSDVKKGLVQCVIRQGTIGDDTILRMTIMLNSAGDVGPARWDCLFSNSNNFCPIIESYVTQQGKLVQLATWEWERIQELYVPRVVYVWQQDEARLGFNKARGYKVKTHGVNIKPSGSQFELSAVGLPEGGLLVDNVANMCYQLSDGNLVPVTPLTSNYRPKHRWNTLLNLQVANVLVIALLSGILVRRYFLRKQGE